MKKNTKKIIIAILIFSMVLGIFAGCNPPDSDKSVTEKYGISMSDKSVTYSGKKHEIGISVDKTILAEKNYSVTYDYNGTILTKAEFEDAGEYSVTAKVKVDGDETVYPITAKLIIKKAPLVLEVGNIFLRQGRGISELGNPNVLFKKAAFVGDDTNLILGTLSFEIQENGTKVTDLSTLKASTSVQSPLVVKIIGVKDLKNYEIKLGEGKFYVLSDADYTTALRLKDDIALVPTKTTINEYNYQQMREFASAANHIIAAYPSLTDIQRLMSGTVDVTSVKTLKKTADTRLEMVYDLESSIESDVGEIKFIGTTHYKNDNRVKDDKLSEMNNTNKASITKAEFGDTTAFEVIIYDTLKYKFTGVSINGKEYFPDDSGAKLDKRENTKYTENTYKYTFGTARGIADIPAGSDYKVDGNPGVKTGGIDIKNEVLGALDGKSTLTVAPLTIQVYDTGVYKGSSTTKVKSNNIGASASELGYKELSNVVITSKGSKHFDLAYGKDERSELRKNGEYKLEITAVSGFGLVSVEIGSKTILASSMTNDSYTFTLTEDYLTTIGKDEIVKIVPTFEKVFSVSVVAETVEDSPKTVSNTDKNGIFETNAGTITLGGVSQTTIPTVGEQKSLKISVVPVTDWLINKVIIYQGAYQTTALKVDLTADFTGKLSSSIIDFSDTAYKNFDSKNEVIIRVEFRQSYDIVVNSVFNDKTVEMSKSSGNVFSGIYGKVEILNLEKEAVSHLAKGGKYFIKLEPVVGYVPKSIKVNGILVMSETLGLNEGIRYPIIKNEKSIVINNTTEGVGNKVNMSSVAFDTTDAYKSGDTFLARILDERIEVGEKLVIEVEYEAYYMIEVDNGVPNGEGYSIDFGKMLIKDADGNYTVAKEAEAVEESNANKVANYSSTSALIKIEKGGKEFYCYAGDRNIAVKVLAPQSVATGGVTKKYSLVKIIVGCDGVGFDGKISTDKKYSISVNEAIVIPKSVEGLVVKDVSTKSIKPGGAITIKVIAEHE